MLKLIVKLREKTGKYNSLIRKQGLIPAILYGNKIKNVNLLVKEQEFENLYKKVGESTLIKINIEDSSNESEKERIVLIYDVAKDPVSDRIIHADFYQVKMDEEITIEVPLVFIGESKAVESDKGVLIRNIQTVEIEALPKDLPSEIEVDISALKTFDDNIYIKDLKVADNVKIKNNLDDSVASVIPPRTSAELEDLEETPIDKIEEVEVEEKGKKIEEGEETPETDKEKGGKPVEEESASDGK